LALWVELEVLLIEVPGCHLVAARHLFQKAVRKLTTLLDLGGRDEASALQASDVVAGSAGVGASEESVEVCGDRVVTHHPLHSLHEGGLTCRSGPMDEEELLLGGIARQAIADAALKVRHEFRVTARDGVEERVPFG